MLRILSLTLVFCLCACRPVPGGDAAQVETTLPPTETPTLTVTPAPTMVPMPESLTTVPAGYSAVRNPDGITWGYGVGTGAEVSIPNLTVDAAGAHFRLDGTTIDIPAGEIQDRIKVGQEGALQIYDYDKYGFFGIAFAWHAEQHRWIRADDILSKGINDFPNYKRVQTRAELDKLFDLEKLVLTPFPEDTYFPPLDKVFVDYIIQRDPNITEDINFYNPFGKVTDLSKSPFRPVNFILLEKGEGRRFDSYILTEQVYNPADGTFSLLHFGFDEYDESPPAGLVGKGIAEFWFFTDPPKFFLPTYRGLKERMTGEFPCLSSCSQIAFFKEQNYFTANGVLPEIQRLVEVWLTTGVVPNELENLIHLSFVEFIMTKQ